MSIGPFSGLIVGLVSVLFWMLFQLVLWLFDEQQVLRLFREQFIGLVIGVLDLFSVLAFGLAFGLLALSLLVGLVVGPILGLRAKIEPAEEFAWSWRNSQSRVVAGWVVGLAFGLLFGLGGVSLVDSLAFGLVFGLVAWFAFGFSGKQLIERRMLSPNEGIRRSVKNGLVMGLVSALPLGLINGLFFWVGTGQLVTGLIMGLLIGLLIGLIFWLIAGLGAAIQHYTLRIFLWQSRAFPWKAQQFLDDTVACILLRRVGGGYSFVHRLLMEYLADLPTSPTPTSAAVLPASGNPSPANDPSL